jgi:Spy/CpxP family protein refolding chaperone
MTFLTRFGLAAAVVVAVGLGAGAYAQNTNGGPGPFMGRGGPGRLGGPGGRGGPGGPLGAFGPMLERLNLTDAQKDQVRGIVDSHRDEMKTIADRARPAHEALDAAMTADTFDEATIRSRSMEVANVDADMLVLQARVRSEVFQILTPEQQAQAKQFRAERPRGPRPERGRGQRPPAH